MKYKATLLLLLSCFVLQSQTLNVHVSDWQNRAISFAIINYKNATFNSNHDGFFRISNYQPGAGITIHKLGFADTTITLSSATFTTDTLNLVILLKLKPIVLPEVMVRSSSIEEINPLKADFVLGYELHGENLIELLSDDILLITNAENEVKYRSRPIPGAREIVRDAYGTIHLVTDKCAFRIYPGSASIRVDTVPVDLALLNWNLHYCDAVTDTSVFIRRYKDVNQTIAFFAISRRHNQQYRLLKEVSDIERKNAVVDFANETNGLNQYLASLDLSAGTATSLEEIGLVRKAERMAGMLEMNYSLPSYSFLKMVNDSIFLFVHDLDSLFIYDQHCHLIKSKRINYHHLKIWGKELFVNEEKTKVYAKLIDNSKIIIAEIDLQTGTLKPAFTTIETKFPRNIKIRNNVVYFLAKQKSGTGYTVYSQKLQR